MFFMLDVPSEKAITKDGQESDPCPGLTLLLEHKPDLLLKDVHGRTPLIYSIVNKKRAAALALVSLLSTSCPDFHAHVFSTMESFTYCVNADPVWS